MNIVIAASEAFPFCKTGGLADVAGALAQEFSRVGGTKVLLFLPHYRGISNASSLRSLRGEFLIPIGARLEKAKLSYLKWGNVLVFFIHSQKYFDRSELYYTAKGDYPDNDERFIFYSRAVLEACKFIGFRPDIIHAHDWQAGLLPAYLKTVYRADAFFTKTRSMFTVHNIAYQGYFPRESFIKAGFFDADFTPDKFEYWGGVSYLKTGIVFADKVNTVSPSYARELLLGQKSFGLEGVLINKGANFFGILNGLDGEVWDPQTDTLLTMGYDEESLKGKALCKEALQKELNLTQDENIPLIGIVARMTYQKGVDLLAQTLPVLTDRAQFAIQGKGDSKAQDIFGRLAYMYPGKVAYRPIVDESLAHRIYGGSDIFIMPSRFEPCGLSQMIAMRYGTIPVVSKEGGLKDTVTPYKAGERRATGFFIENLTTDGVLNALNYAADIYRNKDIWKQIMRTAMTTNFSWEKSSLAYLRNFKEILGGR